MENVHNSSRNSKRGIGDFKGGAGFKYTPFRTASDRLYLGKDTEQIYRDVGTIYWTPTRVEDKPRWSHYLDTEKDQMILNWYGRDITRYEKEDSEQIQRLLRYPNLSPSSNKKDKSDKTIQPLKNTYATQTHSQHDEYKNNLEASMRANGMNSVGMINDTKRKEVIDAYALDKPDQVKPFLTKGHESQSKYEANASKRYEDRYKDNPKFLPKKKIPNYKSGPTVKHDEYNKLYTLPDKVAQQDDGEKLIGDQQLYRDWDFIPFILHDIVNKKYLPFRSYINSISDQSDAEWQQIRYLGRADNVQIYTGFARTVSIDFTTVCFSLKELHPMWQRLNYLVGLTKPAGYTTGATNNDILLASPSNTNFIIPPFLKLKVGDMYDEQPVVLTSVSMNIPPEASWELTSDDENRKNNYEYLNGTFTTKKEDEILVGQFPNMAQISISFNFLEKRLPKTNNRHFGHYISEDKPNKENLENDRYGDPDKGFRYNLIHPNPGVQKRQELERQKREEAEKDADPKGIIPDPFEGMRNPVCTTYPPSAYYRSKATGNLKTKESERIKGEIEEWKDCACKEIAKLMEKNPETASCKWGDDGCVDSVGDTKVPDGLRCVYNKNFAEEPEEEEDIEKPAKCPYPIGGVGEKDDDGRLIGYEKSQKESVEAKEASTLIKLKKRNLNYWIKDIGDYLAKKMGKGKIGGGPYTLKDASGKENPPLSKIRHVSSSNGAVVIEFDDNGNPSSYAGQAVPGEHKTSFKINCTPDDVQDIREIAGHWQPIIYVDVTSGFKIKLNTKGTNTITESNYKNISAVKALLSDFVGRALTVPLWGDNDKLWSFKDLTSDEHKGTPVDTDKIYYVPYEEDREKLIKGVKVFPSGNPEYVNYEVNPDVSDQLNLGDGKKYAELKLGFFATVSKTKRKLSGTGTDKYLEDKAADHIFDQLFKLNGTEYKLGQRREIEGMGGDGTDTQNDAQKAKKLGKSESRFLNEHIEDLKQKKVKVETLHAQMRDKNLPVANYKDFIVGDWKGDQKQLVIDRMQDMKYQAIISEKYNLDATQIQIENYLVLLKGTSKEAQKEADFEFRKRANVGRLTVVNQLQFKNNDLNQIEASLATAERRLEDVNEILEKDDEDVLGQGVYFSNKSSDKSKYFLPWKKDHVLEKIEFNDDGKGSVPGAERETRGIVPEPKPKTETPTPNKQPTWKWPAVASAERYEIFFEGATFVTKRTYFKAPKSLKTGLYTIKVKAGVPNKSGTGLDWSTFGTHEVKIDKRSVPPKPPKCPYKLGSEGEKDGEGRDIGLKSGQLMESAIERNVKLWIGDTMAYIMAKEDKGSLTYPCPDAKKVSISFDGSYLISVYEQNQMKWMYQGDSITKIKDGATSGIPVMLNADSLSGYDFDVTCGPTTKDVKGGGETTDSPDEKLKTPEPHSSSPTENSRPMWKWSAIQGANRYKSTLRSIKTVNDSNGNITGVSASKETLKDYGIVQFSEKTEASPQASVDDGYYEISVIAQEIKNGSVSRSSDAGKHMVEVKGSKFTTPTPVVDPDCADYPKPNDEKFKTSAEYCSLSESERRSAERSDAGTKWKRKVSLYLACRKLGAKIYSEYGEYNRSDWKENDKGEKKCEKVYFQGKSDAVDVWNMKENTFIVNKGNALEGDEREAYIAEKSRTWNATETYKGESKVGYNEKLSDCPSDSSIDVPTIVKDPVTGFKYKAMVGRSKSIPVGTQPADISIRTMSEDNANYDMEVLLKVPRDLIPTSEPVKKIAEKFKHIIKINPSSDGRRQVWTARWWLTVREANELEQWRKEYEEEYADF